MTTNLTQTNSTNCCCCVCKTGPGLDTAALTEELDKCLLTDDELAQKLPRRSSRLKSLDEDGEDDTGGGGDAGHDHGHGHAAMAAAEGEGEEEEMDVAAESGTTHDHGHDAAQRQAQHGDDDDAEHHHGHGHDAEGNCVGLEPEEQPWLWWRGALGKDTFPPYEVDCCAPGVVCKERDHSKTLKKAVAEDLRTRGVLANKKQDELADASAGGDLAKMTELLDGGLAKVSRTSVVNLGGAEPDSDDSDEEEEEEQVRKTPFWGAMLHYPPEHLPRQAEGKHSTKAERQVVFRRSRSRTTGRRSTLPRRRRTLLRSPCCSSAAPTRTLPPT